MARGRAPSKSRKFGKTRYGHFTRTSSKSGVASSKARARSKGLKTRTTKVKQGYDVWAKSTRKR